MPVKTRFRGMQCRAGLLVGFLAKTLLDHNSAYDIIFRILVPSAPAAGRQCKLHGTFHGMILRHFSVAMQ